jgi:hypothetical protein
MPVPGFSAEMSLFKSGQTYLVSEITPTQHSQVVPQMRISCVVDALGAYQDCLGNGARTSLCNYVFHRNLWLCGLGA